ncbi:DUF421 domain-containing protein [Dankookia rubra]|uniref:DUF421 domain-containing protein n=1 Tax=Dankookia rubra TaxID=1442381 RepID=UPI0019D5979D|nr:YetF domain-containing protein [Dankookia rubra]
MVIFAYGLAIVHLVGRRVFGEWAALDIIVSVVVGLNLSRVLTGSAKLWGTLAATTLLMALHWIFAHLATRFPTLSRVFEGRPVHLGEDGRVDGRALRRHAVSEADLGEALRGSGFEDLSGTRRVVLEPSGKISVLKDH